MKGSEIKPAVRQFLVENEGIQTSILIIAVLKISQAAIEARENNFPQAVQDASLALGLCLAGFSYPFLDQRVHEMPAEKIEKVLFEA